jgi:hypothetical protein
MPGITTEFLFSMTLEVPVLALGETPYGGRRIARFDGGGFDCGAWCCRAAAVG